MSTRYKYPVVSAMIVMDRMDHCRFDVDPANVLDTSSTFTNVVEYVSRITNPDATIDDLQQTMSLEDFNALLTSVSIPYVLVKRDLGDDQYYGFDRIRVTIPGDEVSPEELLNRFLKELVTYSVRKYADDWGIIFSALTALYSSIYGKISDNYCVANHEIWNLLFMKRNIPFYIDRIKMVSERGIVRDGYDMKEVYWDGKP